ncbi:hypothetical protein MSZK_52490 [Mycobacterium sp. shizuoka-1]|nr:hypothetical protein MSZK_52490 [Mycobacterium sp. shizuoka-1]
MHFSTSFDSGRRPGGTTGCLHLPPTDIAWQRFPAGPYPGTVDTDVLDVDSSRRRIVDLTDEVRSFCRGRGDGLCNVFVPHATAGLAIIETGAGSDDDLLDTLERLLPRDERYRHSHGSPGHGADHVLPAIVAPSVTLPVTDGTPLLGTWQSVVLVDLNRDNPRRSVRLSFVGG